VDTAKQESFGALLRRYRVAAGLSQEALAERAQMSARGISDLERGLRRFPQPATVMQLMDALELEPADRAALEAVSRPYRPAPQTREANDEGPGRDWVLLETKLAVPPARADLIPRARLITQLDHGVQGPLTVIAAPAGYGKSTLIAAWHAARLGDRPAVAWVSLDERDSDPTMFWTAVFAALEPGLPRWRPRVEGTFLLAHGLMVAEIALAFRRAARAHPGRDLLVWECDWQVSETLGRLPVLPDARLIYEIGQRRIHAFIEADRGSERSAYFGRKVDRYLDLYRDGRWRAHLPVWPLVLTSIWVTGGK